MLHTPLLHPSLPHYLSTLPFPTKGLLLLSLHKLQTVDSEGKHTRTRKNIGIHLQSILGACWEVLAGERSYSYTLDQRTVLSSIWEGRPLPLSVQLWEGCTWIGEGGRGHLPSQPDQPNQPWRSMGWQMSQPDRPHILQSILQNDIAVNAKFLQLIPVV